MPWLPAPAPEKRAEPQLAVAAFGRPAVGHANAPYSGPLPVQWKKPAGRVRLAPAEHDNKTVNACFCGPNQYILRAKLPYNGLCTLLLLLLPTAKPSAGAPWPGPWP